MRTMLFRVDDYFGSPVALLEAESAEAAIAAAALALGMRSGEDLTARRLVGAAVCTVTALDDAARAMRAGEGAHFAAA